MVEGKNAVAGQLETVTNDSPLLGELGPHNSRFYYDIVLENGSNVRVYANMLQVCYRFRARSTNVSI